MSLKSNEEIQEILKVGSKHRTVLQRRIIGWFVYTTKTLGTESRKVHNLIVNRRKTEKIPFSLQVESKNTDMHGLW